MKQRIIYRLRRYWRVLHLFFCLCPKCGNWVNFTRSKKLICPNGCNL